MTQVDLDKKSREQLRLFGAHLADIGRVIAAKVADARAHASSAITQTLKDEPDGRPTHARVRRSRSYLAAISRLAELHEDLAGPSVRSLQGRLRDAREESYVQAFGQYKGLLDPSLWVSPDPGPTRANVAAVRALPLHGKDLRDEVGHPIKRAAANLHAAVALAALRSSPEATSTDVLDTWQARTERAILASARLALSDGQVAADVRAGRDLVHPDHLDHSPIEGPI